MTTLSPSTPSPSPVGPVVAADRRGSTAARPLLTLHITTSAALIGADAVLLVLGIAGVTGSDPPTIYPAMRLVAVAVLAPLAVTALGSGVLLAVNRGWGLFRYWWTTIKLAITATLTTLAIAVLVPGLARAADASTGTDAGDVLTDARQLLFVVIPAVALTLLLVNVALGVYRPRWRLRAHRRGDDSASPSPVRPHSQAPTSKE
jgi:hypothetical protein